MANPTWLPPWEDPWEAVARVALRPPAPPQPMPAPTPVPQPETELSALERAANWFNDLPGVGTVRGLANSSAGGVGKLYGELGGDFGRAAYDAAYRENLATRGLTPETVGMVDSLQYRPGGGQVLAEELLPGAQTDPIWRTVKQVGGLVGDIATDPITAATSGLAAGARMLGLGVRAAQAGNATRAAKLLGQGGAQVLGSGAAAAAYAPDIAVGTLSGLEQAAAGYGANLDEKGIVGAALDPEAWAPAVGAAVTGLLGAGMARGIGQEGRELRNIAATGRARPVETEAARASYRARLADEAEAAASAPAPEPGVSDFDQDFGAGPGIPDVAAIHDLRLLAEEQLDRAEAERPLPPLGRVAELEDDAERARWESRLDREEAARPVPLGRVAEFSDLPLPDSDARTNMEQARLAREFLLDRAESKTPLRFGLPEELAGRERAVADDLWLDRIERDRPVPLGRAAGLEDEAERARPVPLGRAAELDLDALIEARRAENAARAEAEKARQAAEQAKAAAGFGAGRVPTLDEINAGTVPVDDIRARMEALTARRAAETPRAPEPGFGPGRVPTLEDVTRGTVDLNEVRARMERLRSERNTPEIPESPAAPVARGPEPPLAPAGPAAEAPALSPRQRVFDAYVAKLREAHRKNPGAYAYPESEIPAIAERVLAKPNNVSVNPSLQAALRDIGIKPTIKAFREFLGEPEAPRQPAPTPEPAALPDDGLQGFTDAESPLRRGLIKKHLANQVRLADGEIVSNAEEVQRAVTAGAVVDPERWRGPGGQKNILRKPNGDITLVSNMQADYARYLIARRDSKPAPAPEAVPESATPVARPQAEQQAPEAPLPLNRVPEADRDSVREVSSRVARDLADSGRGITPEEMARLLPENLRQYADAAAADATQRGSAIVTGREMLAEFRELYPKGSDGVALERRAGDPEGTFDLVQRNNGEIVGGAKVRDNTLWFITGGRAMDSPVSVSPVYSELDRLAVKRNNVLTPYGADSRFTHASGKRRADVRPGNLEGERPADEGATDGGQGEVRAAPEGRADSPEEVARPAVEYKAQVLPGGKVQILYRQPGGGWAYLAGRHAIIDGKLVDQSDPRREGTLLDAFETFKSDPARAMADLQRQVDEQVRPAAQAAPRPEAPEPRAEAAPERPAADVAIRFPRPPAVAVRNGLKKAGFTYDKERSAWVAPREKAEAAVATVRTAQERGGVVEGLDVPAAKAGGDEAFDFAKATAESFPPRTAPLNTVTEGRDAVAIMALDQMGAGWHALDEVARTVNLGSPKILRAALASLQTSGRIEIEPGRVRLVPTASEATPKPEPTTGERLDAFEKRTERLARTGRRTPEPGSAERVELDTRAGDAEARERRIAEALENAKKQAALVRMKGPKIRERAEAEQERLRTSLLEHRAAMAEDAYLARLAKWEDDLAAAKDDLSRAAAKYEIARLNTRSAKDGISVRSQNNSHVKNEQAAYEAFRNEVRAALDTVPDAADLTPKQKDDLAADALSSPGFANDVMRDGPQEALGWRAISALARTTSGAIGDMEGLKHPKFSGVRNVGGKRADLFAALDRARTKDEIAAVLKDAEALDAEGKRLYAEEKQKAEQEAEAEKSRRAALLEPTTPEDRATVDDLTSLEREALRAAGEKGANFITPSRSKADATRVRTRLEARGLIESDGYTLTDAGKRVASAAFREDERWQNGIPFAEHEPRKVKPEPHVARSGFTETPQWFVSEFQGRPYFSNGHWVSEGSAPKGAEQITRQMDRVFDVKLGDPLRPVAITGRSDRGRPLVWMSDGSGFDRNYFDMLRARHPKAEMFGEAGGGEGAKLVFREDGRTVAILMPLRADDAPEGVKMLLEQAKGEPAAQASAPAATTKAPRKKATRAGAPPKAEPTTPAGIQDAGEKIGGARKDWRDRELTADDLQGMTGGEEAQAVKKANIWRPDYAALVEAGMPRDVAGHLKLLYDRLAAGPSVDTPEGRRAFLSAVEKARDTLQRARTKSELVEAVRDVMAWANSNLAAGRQLLRGGSRRWGITYGDSRRVADLIEGGFPGKAEPWRRKYTVHEWARSYKENGEGARWGVTEGRRIVADNLGSKAEAEAEAKRLYEEAPTTTGRPEQPKRPHLENLERTGKDVRGGRDIGSDDFVRDFGFRGVEFGNWAAQDERRKMVNMGYEALHDLAGVLGIPLRALSLDGRLGLAFGARGSGKAMAHYEPGKLVINLTKKSGAGTLAHEWGHALDHHFGELDRPDAYSGMPRGASGWYGVPRDPARAAGSREKALANLRPEMRAAWDRVMATIFGRDLTQADRVRAAELDLENRESWVVRAKEALETATSEERKKQIREAIKGAETKIEAARARLARERGEEWTRGRAESSYYAAAKGLSGQSGAKGYWARPTEMLARAFESFVADRIEGKGERSDYLVHSVKDARAYPTGLERDAINEAFDNLVQTMRSKETDRGVTLYQRPTEAEWDNYNGTPKAERNRAYPQAVRDAEPIAGSTLKVADFEGDVPRTVLEGLQRDTAPVARALTAAAKRIEALAGIRVPLSGFTPAGNMRGVNFDRSIWLNVLRHTEMASDRMRTHHPNLAGKRAQKMYARLIANRMLQTLRHEAAHAASRGHGAEFRAEMVRIQTAIGAEHERLLEHVQRALLDRGASGRRVVDSLESLWAEAKPGWVKGEARGKARADRGPEGDARSVLQSERDGRGGAEGVRRGPEGARGDGRGDPGGVRGGVAGAGRVGDAAEVGGDRVGADALHGDRGGGRAADSLPVRASEEAEAEAYPLRRDDPRREANFRRWFGESKVVDKDGKPLVVYHGTTAAFDAFRKTASRTSHPSAELGFFFSREPWIADLFAKNWDNAKPFEQASQRPHESGASTLPVFVSLQNPKRMSAEDFREWRGKDEWKALRSQLERDGYDGIVIEADRNAAYGSGLDEWMADTYVAFRPEQIKSATGNRGSYSPTDPRMAYQRPGDEERDMGARLRSGLEAEEEQYRQRQQMIADEEAETGSRLRGGLEAEEAAWRERNPEEANWEPRNPELRAMRERWKAEDGPSFQRPRRTGAAFGQTAAGTTVVSADTKLQKLQRLIQDNFNRWATVQKDVVAATGRMLDPKADVYNTEIRFHGRSAEILRVHNQKYKEPLVEAMRKTKSENIDLEAADYLSLLHKPARDAALAANTLAATTGNAALQGPRGAASGWTQADADARWAELEAKFGPRDASGRIPALEPIAEIVRDMIRQREKLLVKYGLVSRKTIREWKRKYGPDYVPQRDFEGDDEKGQGIGRRYEVRGQEAVPAMGRSTHADNPIAFVMNQLARTVVRGEKMKVGHAVRRLAKQYPELGFEINKKHMKGGKRDRAAEENDFHVKRKMRNGEIKEVRITLPDPLLARALKGLDAEQGHVIVDTIGKATRTFTQLVTSWNPEFLWSNQNRDVLQAIATLGVEKGKDIAKKLPKYLPGAMRGMWQALRDKNATGEWATWAREFMGAGGRAGWYNIKNAEDLAKDFASDVNAGTVKRNLNKALKFVEDANGMVEGATRLAAYRALREAGVPAAEAAVYVKGMTLNFNKRGEWGQAFNSLYAFSNASVQGVKRLGEVLNSPKGRAVGVSIMGLGLTMDMLNRSMSGDDDKDGKNDYDAIPDFVKERNLILPTGGKPLTIPLPYGFNVLYAAGANLSAAMSGAKTPGEAAGAVGTALTSMMNPLGASPTWAQALAPTVLDPVMQISENVDFAGNPVQPDRYPGDRRPDSQVAFHTVSPTARWLAESFNKATGGDEVTEGLVDVSPETLELLASFVTGGLGRFARQSLEAGGMALTGEAPSIRQTPFLRRMVYEEHPGALPGRYREMVTDLEQAEDQYAFALKEKDMERAKSLRKQVRLKTLIVNDVESQIKKLRKLGDLSPKLKEKADAKIRTLQATALRRAEKVLA